MGTTWCIRCHNEASATTQSQRHLATDSLLASYTILHSGMMRSHHLYPQLRTLHTPNCLGCVRLLAPLSKRIVVGKGKHFGSCVAPFCTPPLTLTYEPCLNLVLCCNIPTSLTAGTPLPTGFALNVHSSLRQRAMERICLRF